MSLIDLIRKKRTADRFATVTVATFATDKPKQAPTVASVAGVTVANATEPVSAPLSPDEEQTIRRWLELIEETDAAIITEVLNQCQRDADARAYFIKLATAKIYPEAAKGR